MTGGQGGTGAHSGCSGAAHPVAHFYHVWCGGQWGIPVAEHLYALTRAAFDGPVTVGLVGPAEQRELARATFAGVYPDAAFVEASRGYEQVTLAAVRAWAAEHDGSVLYAHTKGAGRPIPFQAPWRRSMTRQLISGWRRCARLLEREDVDAVGCHWLTPERFPNAGPVPHFGGNFWLARCGYLRALPACPTRSRFDAETWLGAGGPRVHDLTPGWPSPQTCRPPLGVGRLRVRARGRLLPGF